MITVVPASFVSAGICGCFSLELPIAWLLFPLRTASRFALAGIGSISGPAFLAFFSAASRFRFSAVGILFLVTARQELQHMGFLFFKSRSQVSLPVPLSFARASPRLVFSLAGRFTVTPGLYRPLA